MTLDLARHAADRGETRLLHLTEQFGRPACTFREPQQRLAAAGRIGRGRAEQLTQLRRCPWIEPAPCAARQACDFPERLFGDGVVALLKNEHRNLEKAELTRIATEDV